MQYVQHISTVCRYLYSFHWINFSDKNFLKSETIVFPHLKISPIALRFYSQTSIILLPVLLRSTLTANFWPVWRIPKGIGKEPNDPESLFKLWFRNLILNNNIDSRGTVLAVKGRQKFSSFSDLLLIQHGHFPPLLCFMVFC